MLEVSTQASIDRLRVGCKPCRRLVMQSGMGVVMGHCFSLLVCLVLGTPGLAQGWAVQNILWHGGSVPGSAGTEFVRSAAENPRAGFTSAGVAVVQYGTTTGHGVWKYSASGVLEPLALQGQSVPDQPGVELGQFWIRRGTRMSLAVGGDGNAAFHAELIDSASQQPVGSAVFLSEAGSGVRTLIRSGDLIQDGSGRTFSTARQLYVHDGLEANAYGSVALFAEITRLGGTEPRDAILVLDAEGSSQVVAEVGSVAPGLPGVTFEQLGILDLQQNGDLAFTAVLSGELATTGGDRSIWLWRNGQEPTLLIRQGDPAPGINDGATFSGFNLYGRDWLLPDGSAVFQGFVGSGPRGVWIVSPEGEVDLVGTGLSVLPNGDFFDATQPGGVSNDGVVYLPDNQDGFAVWSRTHGLQLGVDPAILVPGQDNVDLDLRLFEVNKEGWVVFSGVVSERVDTPQQQFLASEVTTLPRRWVGLWRKSTAGVVESIVLEEIDSEANPYPHSPGLRPFTIILDISDRGEVLFEARNDGKIGIFYYGPIPEPTAMALLAIGMTIQSGSSRKAGARDHPTKARLR